MRRLLVIPALSTVIVACVVAGAAGAGATPGSERDVAKTTIGPAPGATAPPPTFGPGPTGPTGPAGATPTVPVPTAPVPTVAVASVPVTTGAVPATEDSGISPESLAIALPIFGLDAARLQCLDAALPDFTSDDNVALAALQGCGIALMPILRGMVDVAQRSNLFLDPTASTVVLPTVPGAAALPEGDAFYIGFMLLLPNEQVSCLATGLGGATSEDDATAVAILQRCDVALAFTLDMLSFALVGDSTDSAATTVPLATTPLVTTPLVTTPVVTTPVVSAVPPTVPGGISPDDPLVDQFQQMLLDQQGISLDDRQAACVLSSINAGGVDTTDVTAMLALMESCGIALTDLVTGGMREVLKIAAAAPRSDPAVRY